MAFQIIRLNEITRRNGGYEMNDKTDREIMQMALEALEVLTDNYDDNAVGIEIDAIIDLRKRLARPDPLQRLTDVQQEIEAALAPEQKPVAWLSTDSIGERYLWFSKPLDNDKAQPLYTAPQKREWQKLGR